MTFANFAKRMRQTAARTRQACQILKTTNMGTKTILAGALAVTTAPAQSDSRSYRQLTLAPADAADAGGGAGDDEKAAAAAELAKKLQNPVASLISVPIQNNWDFGYGSANAMRYTVTVRLVGACRRR